MIYLCTGANKSEGLFRDGGDFVIGGDESGIVICGDAVDGVTNPGTKNLRATGAIGETGHYERRKGR